MLNQYRHHLGQFKTGLHAFRLTGADTRAFLQSQSTFNVSELTPGSFHLAAFLDPQGRTEVYGWLVYVEGSYVYLVPERLKATGKERLERFLISEDVTIDGPHWEDWWFALGPKARSLAANAPLGEIFGESARLLRRPLDEVPIVDDASIALWRGLTGWPTFDGAGFEKEIINNQRLYDLAVSQNKGCYPGQETVSKIAVRRGAAYAPVLLEVETPLATGELVNFGRKIGNAGASFVWEGKTYQEAKVLRDFRVEGMKIEGIGTVRYYPLISGKDEDKARELFYEGTEHFKNDQNDRAEECLRRAIDLDPAYADAYEALGVLLGRLEQFPEAAEIMHRLIEVDPTSVMAHSNLSLYLMRMGKIEEAEEHKSKATIKSFQKFGEEARLKEEVELRKKQQAEEWQKRESMFHQVLEIDDEDTLANYGLGSIAVEKGEWEKARKHLVKVLEADPKYSVAYLALGRAYLGLGLKEEAKKTWKEGVAVAASKGDLMPANQMQAELEGLGL